MYAVGSSASSSGAYGHTRRFSHAETSVVRAMGSTAAATSTATQVGGVMRFPVRRRLRPRAPVEVLEARELLQEGELHGAGRPVALLADDDLGQSAVLVGGFVLLLAVDEHDDVRVLLQAAALTKVRQLRPLLGPRFRRARELAQRDHGHAELLGQPLQRPADRRHLLLAVLHAARPGHELEVVD